MVEFCSFHDGRVLGALEKACVSSFLRHGHRLKLYSYDRLEVPEGVILADARQFVPASERDAFFAVAPGRVSQFSNGFRYAMLYHQGGWWVDTDVLCIGAEMPNGEVVLGWQSDPTLSSQPARVGTSIVKLPAGHELTRKAHDGWRENWGTDAWGATGPQLLTSLVEELHMTDHVMPFGSLFRLPWNDVLRLFDPTCMAEARKMLDRCSLVHLANSGLGFTGLKRNVLPPPGSVLRGYIEPLLSSAELSAGDAAFMSAIVSAFRALQATAAAKNTVKSNTPNSG
jgi:hypothetical protein